MDGVHGKVARWHVWATVILLARLTEMDGMVSSRCLGTENPGVLT